MAYTAPRTWTNGEIVTDTIMNAHVRDNLIYLKSQTDVAALYNATNTFSAAQDFSEIATPSTPASGKSRLFAGSSGLNNGVLSCLDDGGTQYQMVRYAETTFTATFAGSGTTGSWTYSVQSASYVRVGNLVQFWIQLQAATRPVAPTGNARIAGLPITVGTPAAVIALANDFSGVGATALRAVPNGTVIDLYDGTSALAATSLSASALIYITGSYKA